MLWLAVHLPQLSLESFAATLDPAGRQRPLALIEAHRITQADARAAALGVQPGAKRATALALAPDLLLGQADAARDALALQAVGHAALTFTPMVCLQPDDGAGTPAPVVLLEVQASLRCFGGLRRLLERLRRALQPLGHRCCIASAPTALGAALLARWRDDLASGAHSVDIAALRRLLSDAPVWLLGTGRANWEALQGMGLRRLADLRHLPRTGLARRFGPALLAELDRACGDAPDPRRPIVAPPVFGQRIELFTRADHAGQLMAGARVLIERLLAWARARHSRVRGFTLLMHHETRQRMPSSSELAIGLAEPSADAAHLQALLAERLGRLPLPAPALELSLHCAALVPCGPPNGELFPTRGGEREGLARLVERLQARLGADGVQRLVLAADHRPERATGEAAVDGVPVTTAAAAASLRPRMAKTVAASTRSQLAAAVPMRPLPADAAAVPVRPLSAEAAAAPMRPLWLLREPQPLVERAARLWLDGAPLQLLAGPERIEAGWWDGALAARDYFIARVHGDALVWVYRLRVPPGKGSGWFLQGRFA